MGVLLFVILLLISIASFLEGKHVTQRWLKFVLSALLSAFVAVIMTGCMEGIMANDPMKGLGIYILLFFGLPISTFVLFQLLLFEIRFVDK